MDNTRMTQEAAKKVLQRKIAEKSVSIYLYMKRASNRLYAEYAKAERNAKKNEQSGTADS